MGEISLNARDIILPIFYLPSITMSQLPSDTCVSTILTDTADRTSKSLDSLMATLRINLMDVEPAKYPELEKQLMKDINKMKQ